MESKNPIQVTDRLFQVIETLGALGPSSLATLCQHIDLNKSTIHRLLSSLQHVGYVTQNPESGKYMLSYRFLSLSNQILTHVDYLDVLKPYFKRLSTETGETVHFVQLDGNHAIYIHKEEAYQNSIRMASKVGSRIPLYCSGVGKAILADMKKEQVHEIWQASSIQSLTPKTITSYDRLLSTLEQIRRDGFSMDNEENELGVRCVAASIPNYKGEPEYAFSISGPINRMDDAKINDLTKLILETKQEILKVLSSSGI